MKANGNTVDVDLELAEMGKTSMAFQTLLAVSQMKQAQMRAAITGRG
jgi:flagellar basal body rod protein FlgB